MMAVLAVRMVEGHPVVTRFRTLGRMVAVPQTRRHPDGGRQRNDTHRAEQDYRTCQSRYRFPLQASVPDPAGTHHDVNLQQHGTEVRGLYEFGLAGMGSSSAAVVVRMSPGQSRSGTPPRDQTTLAIPGAPSAAPSRSRST